MGEAKRRKQILKEDYGKKISKLKPGSPLFNNHVKNFYVALTKRLSEIIQKFPPNQPTKIEKENFKTWVKDYLSKYQETDQETLVIVIIRLIDKSLDAVNTTQELSGDSILRALFGKVFIHQILNPFLPEEIAKDYNKSFQKCYDKIIEGMPQEEEESAEIESILEQIRQNIAELLELEDSKRGATKNYD